MEIIACVTPPDDNGLELLKEHLRKHGHSKETVKILTDGESAWAEKRQKDDS